MGELGMDVQTVAAYNTYAQKYNEETKDFWNKFPQTFLHAFVAERPTTVLDVGSGPGRDALLLKTHNINITCLDASPSMVHITKALGFTSIEGDCLALPFADASFDGVWAYTSLLHIPKKDLPQALQEIHRILKPHGTLGLGLIEGNEECYRITEKVPEARFFALYTQSEIQQALKDAHFSIAFEEILQPNKKRYLHTLAKKV